MHAARSERPRGGAGARHLVGGSAPGLRAACAVAALERAQAASSVGAAVGERGDAGRGVGRAAACKGTQDRAGAIRRALAGRCSADAATCVASLADGGAELDAACRSFERGDGTAARAPARRLEPGRRRGRPPRGPPARPGARPGCVRALRDRPGRALALEGDHRAAWDVYHAGLARTRSWAAPPAACSPASWLDEAHRRGMIRAMLRAYAHDRFTFPVPEGHRFPLEKYALVRRLVDRNPDVSVHEGPPATWAEIGRAHHPEWVRRVRFGLLDRRELAGLGLPWSPALVTRALHACGSTTAAARDALADGVAAALGGGMHHAEPSHRPRLLHLQRRRHRDRHAARRGARATRADPRPRRAPGRRQRRAVRRRPRHRGRVDPRRAELPVHARRRPISTSTCPTAPATTATWRRSTRPSRTPTRTGRTTWRC